MPRKAGLQKLEIMGIRSFSTDEKETIEFQSPLTMIVGANGCGKTTIIECIKFATTGSLPPGAGAGRSFVHDPKVAGQSEVKASIKLRFYDSGGRSTKVVRSMQVRQTKTNASFKQLDGTIVADDRGEKKSMTHRCTELDQTIPLLLGVSKAILENVVFCHQEESSWPLSEPATLKKKFDDIFASARYTKALEQVKGDKKKWNDQAKQLENEWRLLNERKKVASDYKLMARARENEIAQMDEQLADCAREGVEIQGRADELDQVAAESEALDKKIELTKQEVSRARSDIERLRAQMGKDVMNDVSTEELQKALTDLDKKDNASQDKETACETRRREFEQLVDAARAALSKSDTLKGEVTASKNDAINVLKSFADMVGQGRTKEALEAKLADTQHAAERTLEEVTAHADAEADRLASNLFVAKATKEQFSKQAADVKNRIDTLEREVGTLKPLRASQTDLDNALTNHDRAKKDLEQHQETMAAEAAAGKTELERQDRREHEIEVELRKERAFLDDLRSTERHRTKLREARAALDVARKQHDDKLDEVRVMIGVNVSCSVEDEEAIATLVKSAHQAMAECTAQEKVASNTEQQARVELGVVERSLPSTSVGDASSSVPNAEGGSEIRALFANVHREACALQQHVLSRGFRTVDEHTKEAVDTALDGETRAAYFSKLDAFSAQQNLELPRYDEELAALAPSKLTTTVTRAQELESGIGRVYHVYSAFGQVADMDKAALDEHDKCGLCRRTLDDSSREKVRKRIRRVTEMFSATKWATFHEQARAILEKAKQLESKCVDWLELRRASTKAAEQEQSARAKLDLARNALSDAVHALEAKREAADEARAKHRSLTEVAELARAVRDTSANFADETASFERMCGPSGLARTSDEVFEAIRELEGEKTKLAQAKQAAADCKVKLMSAETRLAAAEREASDVVSRARQALERKHEVDHKRQTLADSLEILRKERSEGRDQENKLADAVKLAEYESERHKKETRRLKDEARAKHEAATRELDTFAALQQRAFSAETELASIDARIKQLHVERAEYERAEAQAKSSIAQVDSELQVLRADASQLMNGKRTLKDNLALRANDRELNDKLSELRKLTEQRDADDRYLSADEIKSKRDRLKTKEDAIRERSAELKGKRAQMVMSLHETRAKLKLKEYKNIDDEAKRARIESETTAMAVSDLEIYHSALDRALLTYHGIKIKEVNDLIRELWQAIYQGDDIDVVQIVSGEESNSTRANRSYNYQVQMRKAGSNVNMDMKGRCSAGQRVLASIVVRLALAQAFGLDGSGILCLDEPTTNLDQANRASLARGLATIIAERSKQANFQLIVITHDEHFITTMRLELQTIAKTSLPEYFWRVMRQNRDGKYYSHIQQCDIDSVNV